MTGTGSQSRVRGIASAMSVRPLTPGMAETSIATGDAESARSHYQAFLSYWADAEWELHAVQRAVEKLAAFTE